MCSRQFDAMSRRETVSVEVKNGKIVKLFHSYDDPGGSTFTVKREKNNWAEFKYCLHNVLNVLMLHNRDDFVTLLATINGRDPECYQLGLNMLNSSKE